MACSPAARRRSRAWGLVTPVGNDVETTWDIAAAGRSGGAPITQFDASGLYDAHRGRGQGLRRRPDRTPAAENTMRAHRFALVAAEQALVDAGIRPTPETATRWACAVGAGMMTAEYLTTRRDARGTARDRRTRRRSPAHGPRRTTRCFCARAGGQQRRRAADQGARHPRLRDVRAHGLRVGRQALGTALKMIRRGAVDRCWRAASTR